MFSEAIFIPAENTHSVH